MDVRQILGHATRLPRMPAVALKVLELTESERSTARDIAEVLRSDVSYSATVLRIVNSPSYGLSRTVADIRTAVALLGTKRVSRIALGAHLSELISNDLHGYQMAAETFWVHSNAVAVLAEALASLLGLPDPASAFTAGLLHDIGKLAVSLACRAEQVEIQPPDESRQQLFVEAEQMAVGSDHMEVGHALAVQWKLPEMLAMSARWHHDPLRAPDQYSPICCAVHVANAMAHSLGYGVDLGGLARKLEPEVVERLGLGSEQLELLVCQTVETIEAASALYSVARGGEGGKRVGRR